MGQLTTKLAVISVYRITLVRAHCLAGNFLTRYSNSQSGLNYPYRASCACRQFVTRKISEQCEKMTTEWRHMKARSNPYPRTTDVMRTPVEDNQVPWDVEYPGYDENVVKFTSKNVASGPVWADNPDPTTITDFNQIDKSCNVDRRSYMGIYQVADGFPRLALCFHKETNDHQNPKGRTGVHGRGSLGRWGPNHAGDPIVTRWKRDENNEIVHHPESGKPILQFVAVQRSDNKEWALPGGMVNPGEDKTVALKREFGEEALNSLEASDEEKKQIEETINECFGRGVKIYTGYVDDPRNTDNAWMETKAINFHDDVGNGVGAFKLHAGDDAIGVQWMDIDSKLNLYASHYLFIRQTAINRKAHWE